MPTWRSGRSGGRSRRGSAIGPRSDRDPSFDAIRTLPAFSSLAIDLGFPADPFASPR